MLSNSISVSPKLLQIPVSLPSFIRLGHRVRKYIGLCLEHHAKSHQSEGPWKNAAFQLAFCYKVGFGTPSNESQSQFWRKHTCRSAQDLEHQVNIAKKTLNRGSCHNPRLLQLTCEGLLLDDRDPNKSEVEGDQLLAEEGYRREVLDMRRAFGDDNEGLLRFRIGLTSLLETGKKHNEAEVMLIELLESLRREETLSEVALNLDFERYALIHDKQSRRKAQIPKVVALSLELPNVGARLPALLNMMACVSETASISYQILQSLAANYIRQERWQEAEWLYIQLTMRHTRVMGTDQYDYSNHGL